MSRFTRILVGLMMASSCSVVNAAIMDIAVTDVSTRSAAFIWVSDSPVTSARVRIFADAPGTTEITGSVQSLLVSAQFPPALATGVVKVDVSGLEPATTYYVQTETDNLDGTVLEPAVAPFVAVTTATATTLSDALGQSIVNDLLSVNLTAPDGVSTADGTLALIDSDGTSAYPLAVFVNEGFFSAQSVVFDLSNVFDSSGQTARLDDDAIVSITHYRGGLCAGTIQHKSLHYRRIPPQTEFPVITNFANAASCFFADTVCDDVVDGLDLQALLDVFRQSQGSCAFNSDLDLTPDGTINVLDMQGLLNRFGESAPF